ncbi:NgoFVII family restriction endonuclease [Clostridium sp.]|uniref:NgoFVII family restriction endonuclease n=1 Tax=Clostridium sp. TaxID=1506 RepID=UPI002FC63DC1
MANIIWENFLDKEREEYIKFLKIFGALSGLFKDNKEGANAKKPYLYYRNHEQLFAKVFEVEDLTRKDSAFDALGICEEYRIGIGLKTWIHTKDYTYQKVAEFNKLSPILIDPLIKNGTSEDVIKKVAELRNERIMLDKRLYKTNQEVYHFITRDDDVMNIIETKYDLIDIESLELLKSDGKTYSFKDKFHKYKFYRSKSVLLEEFNASENEIIKKIPIKQFDDPFELISMIEIPKGKEEIVYEEIYLPLYQDKKEGKIVSSCSGINIRHAKSKIKGSNIPRPEYEIEVRISVWIHHVFSNFFGINALNNEEVKNKKINDFNLILPDGRKLKGRVKQSNGKSLQTSPQSDLGKWILKDVLGLSNREIVTWDLLNDLGIDSLKVIKLNDKEFKITVAETGAYERFKLENKDKMYELGLTHRQIPYMREEAEC